MHERKVALQGMTQRLHLLTFSQKQLMVLSVLLFASVGLCRQWDYGIQIPLHGKNFAHWKCHGYVNVNMHSNFCWDGMQKKRGTCWSTTLQTALFPMATHSSVLVTALSFSDSGVFLTSGIILRVKFFHTN